MNKRIITTLITITFVNNFASAGVWYVSPTSTGLGDGSSWQNASNLNTALDATNGAASGDDVWVQQGTYNGPFSIKSGIKVYGGFIGNETIVSDSDPMVNETIILGNATNRCISLIDSDSTTLLRGFHLKNGNVNIFVGGSAGIGGGALFIKDSNALIVQNIISNNFSEIGGAVYVYGGSPSFVSNTFHNNGVNGCLSGGAVFIRRGNVTFHNCLFYENEAVEGGAVATKGIATMINCTFADNMATKTAKDIHDYLGGSVIKNSILWDSDPLPTVQISNPRGGISVENSLIKEGWAGTGNVSTDPLFIDPANDKYRFSQYSPCKDSGDNLALPQDIADLDWDGDTVETLPYDLSHSDRIFNSTIDMGTFEFNCTAIEPLLADPDLPDIGFGTSNRYITFTPTNVDRSYALRVTLTNMPSPFTTFEGTKMWVDVPQEVSEDPTTSDPNGAAPGQGTFMLSRLTCNPVYLDWSSIGSLISIYDDEIVPGATYSLQAIYAGCATLPSANYSASLSISTSTNWADVTGDCSVTPCTPPDGIVDIVDVTAVQDKWLGVSIPKARTDLNPDLPDIMVNIDDVLEAANGSNGLPYPFDGPTSCPSGPGGPGGPSG